MLLGGDTPPPAAPAPTRPPAAVGAAPAASRRGGGHVPGELGVWMFIFGDMLVFGVFFGVFMVERGQGLEAFRAGRDDLSTTLGALNTLLLLTGSILVVLAMRAVRDGRAAQAPRLLLGALGTGVLFLVDKGIEYADQLGAGSTPSTNDFWTLFYVFTGIHALHLLVGMAALSWMLVLVRRPRPAATDLGTLESCASYWHLVDLLWVVLFPLFYLVA